MYVLEEHNDIDKLSLRLSNLIHEANKAIRQDRQPIKRRLKPMLQTRQHDQLTHSFDRINTSIAEVRDLSRGLISIRQVDILLLLLCVPLLHIPSTIVSLLLDLVSFQDEHSGLTWILLLGLSLFIITQLKEQTEGTTVIRRRPKSVSLPIRNSMKPIIEQRRYSL